MTYLVIFEIKTTIKTIIITTKTLENSGELFPGEDSQQVKKVPLVVVVVVVVVAAVVIIITVLLLFLFLILLLL